MPDLLSKKILSPKIAFESGNLLITDLPGHQLFREELLDLANDTVVNPGVSDFALSLFAAIEYGAVVIYTAELGGFIRDVDSGIWCGNVSPTVSESEADELYRSMLNTNCNSNYVTIFDETSLQDLCRLKTQNADEAAALHQELLHDFPIRKTVKPGEYTLYMPGPRYWDLTHMDCDQIDTSNLDTLFVLSPRELNFTPKPARMAEAESSCGPKI